MFGKSGFISSSEHKPASKRMEVKHSPFQQCLCSEANTQSKVNNAWLTSTPSSWEKKTQNESRLEIHRKERSKSTLFYTHMKSTAHRPCNQPPCSKLKMNSTQCTHYCGSLKTCQVKANAVFPNHGNQTPEYRSRKRTNMLITPWFKS